MLARRRRQRRGVDDSKGPLDPSFFFDDDRFKEQAAVCSDGSSGCSCSGEEQPPLGLVVKSSSFKPPERAALEVVQKALSLSRRQLGRAIQRGLEGSDAAVRAAQELLASLRVEKAYVGTFFEFLGSVGEEGFQESALEATPHQGFAAAREAWELSPEAELVREQGRLAAQAEMARLGY